MYRLWVRPEPTSSARANNVPLSALVVQLIDQFITGLGSLKLEKKNTFNFNTPKH